MTEPLLDLNKCTIRFGGLCAVSEFDLQIGPTDLVGLIGPNGAGKTTIFNIVTGVYRPTSGTITLNNSSVVGLKPNAITRRGIARTFQNIRLFPSLTVFDNVRAGFNARLRHGLAHALWRMGAFYREENESRNRCRSSWIFSIWAGFRKTFAAAFPTGTSAASKLCARSPLSPNFCCSTSRPPG